MLKIILRIIAIVIMVVLVGFATLFGMLYAGLRPTKGAKIPAFPSPRTALLVVDIQEDYTGSDARKPYRDAARIVAATNDLLGQAEKSGLAVAYIQNVITNPILRRLAGGLNAPCAAGTDMDHRLIRIANAPTFEKHRSDAFSNPGLDAYLRRHQIDHVVIVGLDGAYCVNATTLGALNRGYRVTLATRGIATESRKAISDLAETWRKAGAQVVDMPAGNL